MVNAKGTSLEQRRRRRPSVAGSGQRPDCGNCRKQRLPKAKPGDLRGPGRRVDRGGQGGDLVLRRRELPAHARPKGGLLCDDHHYGDSLVAANHHQDSRVVDYKDPRVVGHHEETVVDDHRGLLVPLARNDAGAAGTKHVSGVRQLWSGVGWWRPTVVGIAVWPEPSQL